MVLDFFYSMAESYQKKVEEIRTIEEAKVEIKKLYKRVIKMQNAKSTLGSNWLSISYKIKMCTEMMMEFVHSHRDNPAMTDYELQEFFIWLQRRLPHDEII